MRLSLKHVLLVALLALASAAQIGHAKEARKSPPNIVVFFSDDHAYQAISAYGDPRKLIETPNIDRLAREGMRFDRCLVTNSICGPSRATLLTGKYSHLNGFYNNTNCTFDGSQTTFPKLLKGAGYQTAMIGKWHLGSNPTGFDEWRILPGQGVYYHPPMIHNGEKIQETGYITDLITNYSAEWLKSRDRSRPFLLMCQHKAPHREWSPAIRHLGHDRDRKYSEPSTLFDDYSGRGLAEHDQHMSIEKIMNENDLKLDFSLKRYTEAEKAAWNSYYEPRNQAFQKSHLEGKDLVRWKYQRYLHDYLGCVKAVDEGVGTILKLLDDEGLAENTIVIYTSDQGFYLGEHGWFDKRWIFEESLRSPLLIRWPGVTAKGSTSTAIVSNLDVAETLLDAAGLSIPDEMQGRSLVPLLRGETPADWRKSFYYEYFEYPEPHHVRPHHGVVTDRHKLVHFEGSDLDAWELFDLKTDPLELTDIYRKPSSEKVIAELNPELERLRKELKIPAQYPRSAYGDAPMK